MKRAFYLLIALYLSYFLLPRSWFWGPLDMAFFHNLNSFLGLGKGAQLLVAIANHKLHDWFVDVVFLTLLAQYIFKPSNKSRSLKAYETFLVLLVMAFVIKLVNRTLLYYWSPVDVKSPSTISSHFYYLNELVPYLKTKMHAKGSSFPGDHATTAFLFFALTRPLFNLRMRKFTLLYVILITLPRLIVGAHNFSDVLIGSSLVVIPITLLVHSKQRLEKLALFLQEKWSKKRIVSL